MDQRIKDISANVSDKALDEDDYTDILDELVDVHAECYDVGTMLHLKFARLNEIRQQKLDSAAAMKMIIASWLIRKTYNVEKFGPPTWKALVDAVAHRAGGNHQGLAMEIADRHPAIPSTDSSPPEATPSQPTAPVPPSLPEPTIGSKDPNYFQEASANRTQIDGGGSYQPHPNRAINKIKYSFGTVSVQDGEKRSNAGAYDMRRWPHGVAVIINNEQFQSDEVREGTEVDERNLVQAFRYLGYVVEVYNNCKAQKILDIMDSYRLLNHCKYDSFVCCILSHGKMGQIHGSDSVMVLLDDITTKLNGDKCPSLAGKPKMFFMQACRGTLKDKGVNVEADDDEIEEQQVLSSAGVRMATDSNSKIPSTKDFFFSYATVSGHVAWRNTVNGSLYVAELCRSLASYASFASLNDMTTITNKRVAMEYANVEYKQSTEVTSSLGSDVFFF